MNKQLTNQLFEKYKRLFPNGRNVDPRENLMYFGFSCGDGWYNILDNMCKTILESMGESSKIEFMQIKEKFGQLRIYMSDVSEDIYETVKKSIRVAERDSAHICECCGLESKVKNKNGWLSTECDNCNKED